MWNAAAKKYVNNHTDLGTVGVVNDRPTIEMNLTMADDQPARRPFE